MAEKDYSLRDVVDKLGVKPGHAVAFVEAGGRLDAGLGERILHRTGRPPSDEGDPVDLVVVVADETTDVVAHLTAWRPRLVPTGGIWVLTPKRGQPGYVDQRRVIAEGLTTALVDNKSCSVSDAISGIRFVVRRKDRRE